MRLYDFIRNLYGWAYERLREKLAKLESELVKFRQENDALGMEIVEVKVKTAPASTARKSLQCFQRGGNDLEPEK